MFPSDSIPQEAKPTISLMFLIQKKKKLDKGQIYCVTTQSHLIWNFVGQESAF